MFIKDHYQYLSLLNFFYGAAMFLTALVYGSKRIISIISNVQLIGTHKILVYTLNSVKPYVLNVFPLENNIDPSLITPHKNSINKSKKKPYNYNNNEASVLMKVLVSSIKKQKRNTK